MFFPCGLWGFCTGGRDWHGRGDWYPGGHNSLQPTILSVPHIPGQPSCWTKPILLTSCTAGNEGPKATGAHPGPLRRLQKAVEMARVWARAQQKFDRHPQFWAPLWRKSQGLPRPWDKPSGIKLLSSSHAAASLNGWLVPWLCQTQKVHI